MVTLIELLYPRYPIRPPILLLLPDAFIIPEVVQLEIVALEAHPTIPPTLELPLLTVIPSANVDVITQLEANPTIPPMSPPPPPLTVTLPEV